MLHFISDLHLSPAAPGLVRLFGDYLNGPARQAERLFILGDFFEVWVGDDGGVDPVSRQIKAWLREASDAGLAISFLHGNRDFLVGEAFATETGVTLLPDPYVLSTPEWQFVLTHGDALCTDDLPYQAFRTQVRNPQWQAAFLAKPLQERIAIAMGLRAQSEAGKAEKAGTSAEYLMDVNPGATDDFIRSHGYATVIHGHTHRPATHDHIVDGIHTQRWVLADWHEAEGTARGEYLTWDGEALARHPLQLSV